MSNLKQEYLADVIPKLQTEFNYQNKLNYLVHT